MNQTISKIILQWDFIWKD